MTHLKENCKHKEDSVRLSLGKRDAAATSNFIQL